MIRTYHTAFTLLVASCMTEGSWMQTWLSTLACTSVLVHTVYATVPEIDRRHEAIPGWHALLVIDSALAHVIFARTALDAMTMQVQDRSPSLLLYYACMLYVGTIYMWKLRAVAHIQHTLHGSMHLAGALGCMALHWAQQAAAGLSQHAAQSGDHREGMTRIPCWR